MKLDKGYTQIYYGKGKGKTTAALGLALRAAGSGLKVSILQFMKSDNTSEFEIISKLSNENLPIKIETFGNGEFYIPGKTNMLAHREYCQKGLERATDLLQNNQAQVVILDELLGTLKNELITFNEVINLMEGRSAETELIITGREAPTELIERCDLATEMTERKHYYSKGVDARKGIEF